MIVTNVSGREIPVWTVGDPHADPIVVQPGQTVTLSGKQAATVRARRALQTGALVEEQPAGGIVRRALRSLLRRS